MLHQMVRDSGELIMDILDDNNLFEDTFYNSEEDDNEENDKVDEECDKFSLSCEEDIL